MVDEGSSQVGWFLEGYIDNSKDFKRWRVYPLPYSVGRNQDSDLCLPFATISGRHAQLSMNGTDLQVRDLGSTNGTFLNRTRISEDTALRDGDLVHFAEYEFRVSRWDSATMDSSRTIFSNVSSGELSEQLVIGVREFHQMLESQAVVPFFQPIVKTKGGERIGYEVLGRGDQEGLDPLPTELFRIAARFGLEAELSRMFRSRGIQEAKKLQGSLNFFVNTHPAELGLPKLMTSLEQLRLEAPDLSITLEIHEAAVTNLGKMRELRVQLTDLGMKLAYDDFGAGQARLLELVEVPPDYLKFDSALIANIHEAPIAKQKLVESLAKMVQEIGVACLAEGVENKEEQEICGQMGFALAQGYLFGKPAPASKWS